MMSQLNQQQNNDAWKLVESIIVSQVDIQFNTEELKRIFCNQSLGISRAREIFENWWKSIKDDKAIECCISNLKKKTKRKTFANHDPKSTESFGESDTEYEKRLRTKALLVLNKIKKDLISEFWEITGETEESKEEQQEDHPIEVKNSSEVSKTPSASVVETEENPTVHRDSSVSPTVEENPYDAEIPNIHFDAIDEKFTGGQPRDQVLCLLIGLKFATQIDAPRIKGVSDLQKGTKKRIVYCCAQDCRDNHPQQINVTPLLMF